MATLLDNPFAVLIAIGFFIWAMALVWIVAHEPRTHGRY